MNVVLRNFQAGDETAFRELNESWIAQYFAIEPMDRKVLGDPVAYVIRPGGQIVMATVDGKPVGCCALVPKSAGVFEIGKMTVSESFRGQGVGRKLLQAVIETARSMGAARLYLESNDKLPDAVHLYESLGFRRLPAERIRPSPYARSNVYMELDLF